MTIEGIEVVSLPPLLLSLLFPWFLFPCLYFSRYHSISFTLSSTSSFVWSSAEEEYKERLGKKRMTWDKENQHVVFVVWGVGLSCYCHISAKLLSWGVRLLEGHSLPSRLRAVSMKSKGKRLGERGGKKKKNRGGKARGVRKRKRSWMKRVKINQVILSVALLPFCPGRH